MEKLFRRIFRFWGYYRSIPRLWRYPGLRWHRLIGDILQDILFCKWYFPVYQPSFVQWWNFNRMSCVSWLWCWHISRELLGGRIPLTLYYKTVIVACGASTAKLSEEFQRIGGLLWVIRLVKSVFDQGGARCKVHRTQSCQVSFMVSSTGAKSYTKYRFCHDVKSDLWGMGYKDVPQNLAAI